MRAVTLFLLLPLLLSAEQNELSERLRSLLAPTGQGEQAVRELSQHQYAAVEQLLASGNPGSEWLAVRAAIEFLDGKPREAVRDFAQSDQAKPLRDSDRFTWAMALVRLDDTEGARRQLTVLAQKNPQQALYPYWLGRLDYELRRYDEAAVKLKNAAALEPASARIWDALGLVYDMQGVQEEARRTLEKAVTLNRSAAHPSPWPPHDLGYLLLRLEQPAAAEAALREALRYDPKFGQAHYHLARCLEKESRNEDAVTEYREAIRLDPSSADACYSLALLYRKLHDEQQAQQMFAEYKRRRTPASP